MDTTPRIRHHECTDRWKRPPACPQQGHPPHARALGAKTKEAKAATKLGSHSGAGGGMMRRRCGWRLMGKCLGRCQPASPCSRRQYPSSMRGRRLSAQCVCVCVRFTTCGCRLSASAPGPQSVREYSVYARGGSVRGRRPSPQPMCVGPGSSVYARRPPLRSVGLAVH